jgi:hypothetical protein
MAQYAGKDWKKADLLSLMGGPYQVGGAQVFQYTGGKALHFFSGTGNSSSPE